MASKNANERTPAYDLSLFPKDDFVMFNGVANLEGSLKLIHLHILIVILIHLQKEIKSSLSSKSGVARFSHKFRLEIPISDFQLGSRNGGRLRRYLEELQHASISIPDMVSTESTALNLNGIIDDFSFPQYARKVQIVLTDDFANLILRPQDGYFTCSRNLAMSFANKYTLRIYLLICSWKRKGGFVIPLERLRTMFSLGPAYERYDNILTKVVAPAYQELKSRGPVWFEYRLYNTATGRYLAFKIKLYVSDEQKEKERRKIWDSCFNILLTVGANHDAVRGIFSRIEHEDLRPFLSKLIETVSFIRKNGSIKDVNSYINTSMRSWLSDWLSRFSK